MSCIPVLPVRPFGCWTNILEMFMVISPLVLSCAMQRWSLVEHVAPRRWRVSLILPPCLSMSLSSLSLQGSGWRRNACMEIRPNLSASRLDDTGGPLAPWLTPTVGCTSVSLAAVSQLSGLRCDRGEALTDSHHLPVYLHQWCVEHFHKTQVSPTQRLGPKRNCGVLIIITMDAPIPLFQRTSRVLAFQYSPIPNA